MTDKRNLMSGLRRVLALTALAGFAVSAAGCIEDADCGVCDPDNLILESIAGLNYAANKIQLLNPECEGEACPPDFNRGTYFIEEVIPCEETDDAKASPSAEEYCKLSPLVTGNGIEFIFNNLLDPTSIELVRKRPDNPQLFEVYDWKSDIVHLEGPITRFNGDYNRGGSDQPDTISRLVNLTCAEQVEGFSAESYQDPLNNPCNQLRVDNGRIRPLKMQPGEIHSYKGIWTAHGSSCSSPQDGPDTCCTYCDWILSTKVARYGVSQPGFENAPVSTWRDLELSPNVTPDSANAAIACATGDEVNTIVDKYDRCRGFNVAIDRSSEEQTWRYSWDAGPQDWRLPLYDKLRETHPDDRPDGLENLTAKCNSSSECGDVHGLSGTECVGVREDNGNACLMDAAEYEAGGCVEGVCRPQWFVTCRTNADTTGAETAYCMDRRFAPTGTAACLIATQGFQGLCGDDAENPNCTPIPPNQRLAFCDNNENNVLTAQECCQDSIGGPEAACDPFYQQNLVDRPRYDRDRNLPEATRACICKPLESLDDEERARCQDAIRNGCYHHGDYIQENDGEYAVKFVARRGGVIYDPALKGFDWRPADLGGVPRADIESCAENNTDRLISGRNRLDGWRANDAFAPESFEDFDRAMCSGQQYTVVFTEPGEGSFVKDKVGNTLEGKSVYTFETPQFHVEPGSGFPTDNLRIGACDDFGLRFSNKYDMSPENLQKLQIFRINEAGEPTTPNDRCGVVGPVAGGPGCAETQAQRDLEDDPCLQPCLTVDVSQQFIGNVTVEIDPTEFGPGLEVGNRYRVIAPMAASQQQIIDNPDLYQQVFWDVCGMPLVAEGAIPYEYEFSIDRPKCKEDEDRDNVQLSCDNAPGVFNPDQGDMDRDGFGDVIDLCPTVAGDNNTADSDRDGVGNDCDTCRQTLTQYNGNADGSVPFIMLVRNIPFQDDTDEDGIGDVCDNCIFEPNCDDYGPSNPWKVGDSIPFDNDNICQRDDNNNLVGNACEGGMQINDFAAGPIGLGLQDDFDQDGIVNEFDACPRQPLRDTITCTSNDDCPPFRKCEILAGNTEGICDHLDSDEDSVGDICDTCPFTPNPMQVVEGEAQQDDPDGDFVGTACETSPQCATTVKDPRPFSFHEVQANGQCCTVQLVEAGNAPEDLVPQNFMGSPEDLLNARTGNPLRDPDGLPIRVNCTPDQTDLGECRMLPIRVANAPGILTPPPGCEEALTDANISVFDNLQRLNDLDFGGDFDALWQNLCFLPQRDQDYDGLGDLCDLCKFDFDPENLPYIDANGRVWPGNGKFCSGEYSIDNKCEMVGDTAGETDGGTEGGTTGGGTTGGGTGGATDSATSG